MAFDRRRRNGGERRNEDSRRRKATDAVDAVSVKKAAAFPVKAARTMINHWTSALSIRVLFR